MFFGLGLNALDAVLERDRAGVVEAGVQSAMVEHDLDPAGNLTMGFDPGGQDRRS